jgi:sigma-B regulation protein RsbU (phosphoserine phosphatase)
MNPVTAISPASVNLESFLLEVTDVVNTTLDLDTLLRRVAELIGRVIEYEIFAILLLNEKTQEMRIRFSIGHTPEVAERLRIKMGEGVTGLAAQRAEAVLVNDVQKDKSYIEDVEGVRSELAVPLIVKNRVIGVIDIEARQAQYFTEEHKKLLQLVASRIAAGIENARLYTRVYKHSQTLTVLNDISRELTSILNLDELLKRIAELLTRLIDYQMFSILLLDPSETKLQHRFSVRFKKNIPLKDEISLQKGLVGWAARHKEPVLVKDVTKDDRYIELNPETRSELAVPLIYQGKAIGVLDLEHTKRAYFTEDHMRTITTLAAQVAIAIENARLYERVAEQERRLELDVAMARELQFRMLPAESPHLYRAQIAARFVPAHAIGGDFYDFVRYSGERTAFAIGDVSGKGVAAALYAGLAGGILRSSAASEPSAAEMLALVNSSLVERPVAAQFVSMIFAIWDDREGTLQIANSGLPRPIYCRGANPEVIQATGLPLGLFEDAEYEELTLTPEPGDLCVFISDGIIDARNRDGDGFGRDHVHRIVAENCGLSAEEIVEAIFSAVEKHSEGQETFDDQTVVVLKFSTPSAESRRQISGARNA